ncbi:MAG: mercuric ion transport protein [Sphingobacteriales bacterium]|jgi:mercuric ion transport protein
MKTEKKWMGAGLLSAFAASLCCITPIIALIAGSSGLAASFSWLEPARPYLIALTIGTLGFAWYKHLFPKKDLDCACGPDEKKPFLQSTLFLGLITSFAAIMLTFPYYSHVFYPDTQAPQETSELRHLKTVEFKIEGMTCTSCEEHINYEVLQLDGIGSVQASYKAGNAQIKYNPEFVDLKTIEATINHTGYTVTSKHEK